MRIDIIEQNKLYYITNPQTNVHHTQDKIL